MCPNYVGTVRQDKTGVLLTQQRGCTENKNNNKISPSDQYGALRCGLSAAFSPPERRTETGEMSLVTEVETGPSVVTEPGVLTLVLVNTLGGSQPSLACRAAGNRNETKVRTRKHAIC